MVTSLPKYARKFLPWKEVYVVLPAIENASDTLPQIGLWARTPVCTKRVVKMEGVGLPWWILGWWGCLRIFRRRCLRRCAPRVAEFLVAVVAVVSVTSRVASPASRVAQVLAAAAQVVAVASLANRAYSSDNGEDGELI